MSHLFKKITVGIFIITGLLMSMSAFAIEYKALTSIPGVSDRDQNIKNPAELVTGVYNVAIGIGAILAVIMIIIAGMKYTTSEAIDSKTGAKEQIWAALGGLILLLGSFLILKTINKDLVNRAITLPAGDGNNLENLQVQRDQVISDINKAAKDYQEALKKSQDLKKEADDVLQEKNKIKEQYDLLADKNSEEAKKLASQIQTLATQYDEKNNQAIAFKNGGELARIDAVIKGNIDRAALAIKDPNGQNGGGVPTALALLTNNEKMYQQKIDLLKTSGAPQSQIDSAISEKNIAISSTKQEILTQTALAEANVAGKLVDFPKALELRNKMVNESSNAINELKKTDPNAATVLQKKAVEDLEKIDAAAAYRANCNTYGKTFNTFTYKCTN